MLTFTENKRRSTALAVTTNPRVKLAAVGLQGPQGPAGSGSGSGDVVGPASSTNNSLARFDGVTGKLLKDGAVIGTDVQAYDADLASWAGVTRASGFDTWVATPSSANLRSLLSDETGTGAAVFADTPTLVTPILGTPTSGTLTNCTGLPVSTGISGLGSGVATWLATPSSANLAAAVTGETGSGALVFGTSPGFTTAANPVSNDGASLGISGTAWSDLFLASGAVINWDAGNVTLTHTTGTHNPALELSARFAIAATPSYTLVSSSLAVSLLVGFDSGTPSVTASKALSAVRVGRPNGTGTTVTLGASSQFSGVDSQISFASGSDSSGAGYGGVFHVTNAGPADTKGVHVAAFGSGTSSGVIVAANCQLQPVATTNVGSSVIQLSLSSTIGATSTAVATGINVSSSQDRYSFVLGCPVTSIGVENSFIHWKDNGNSAAGADFLRLENSSGTVLYKVDKAGASYHTVAYPISNDGAALGSTSSQWSDLFLAEGGVINWDNGDATLTQSGNTVTLGGAGLTVTVGDILVSSGIIDLRKVSPTGSGFWLESDAGGGQDFFFGADAPGGQADMFRIYSATNNANLVQVNGQGGSSPTVTLAAGTTVSAGRMTVGSTDALLTWIPIAVGDETTAITSSGNPKVTFRMPYAFTVTAVRASLTTASSSGVVTVDINEAGTSILSTKLTIDQSEETSTTAATPAVISDTSLADDAEITIDIDGAGTGAAGLKVYLLGYKTTP
jgi:hypothetical protein